jgi:hypothetical protein
MNAGQNGQDPGPTPQGAVGSGTDAPRAPVIVVHGVGDFAAGALVEDIAQSWRQNGQAGQPDKLRRYTLFLAQHRYTVLEEECDAGQGRRTRFVEVNWSEVRRTTATIWGLLKNFAWVMLTLTRIGTRGVQGSASLAQPLRLGALVIVLVEALLVWAALLPALSALLWRLPMGSRFGISLVLAAGLLYLASWVWRWSKPMAAGALGFALFSLWAGYVACVVEPTPCASAFCGRDLVTYLSGRIHSAAVLATGLALSLAMLEVLWHGAASKRRCRPQHWTQPLARVACLWLPAVMLAALQPLTVSALLTTFSSNQMDRWGSVYQQGMLFAPQDGYAAAIAVLVMLAATMVVGALQYLAVRHCGRVRSVLLFAGLSLLAVLVAHWARGNSNPRCADCLHPGLTDAVAAVLVLSAWVGFFVFKQRPSLRAAGADWHPAGKYARYWASRLLYLAPLGLLSALGYLGWAALLYTPDAGCTKEQTLGCLTASDYFLLAGKYALLLLPLAAKPAAALIDALGDVFYWFVPSAALNTRLETRSRFDAALAHVLSSNGNDHVVIFAHSQGTVIATDALCELAQSYAQAQSGAAGVLALSQLGRQLHSGTQRITLVTVGSPLSSLYHSFFGVTIGREYLGLCHAQPQRFAWVNFCRAADYIGSRVVLPGVQNYLLATPGDHTGYWDDPVLLQWLGRYVAGHSTQQSAGFPGGEALLRLNGEGGGAPPLLNAAAAP